VCDGEFAELHENSGDSEGNSGQSSGDFRPHCEFGALNSGKEAIW
jgi:hypothetical protein